MCRGYPAAIGNYFRRSSTESILSLPNSNFRVFSPGGACSCTARLAVFDVGVLSSYAPNGLEPLFMSLTFWPNDMIFLPARINL